MKTPQGHPAELNQLAALLAAGRYPELERIVRDLLRQRPVAGILWKVLAISLFSQGKDPLQALERATALLPDDAEVHCDRGAALLNQGMVDDAMVWFRHALRIKPEFFAAHHSLGIALWQAGRLPEAAASFRRALALDAAHPDALAHLGDVLQQTGAHEEAIACYRQALQLQPRRAGLHHGLGSAWQSLGKGGAAEASYRQAVALDPEAVDASVSLAKLLRLANRADEALACIRQLLTRQPDEPRALVAYAELQYGGGDHRGAAATFRRVLAVDAAHPAARIGAVVAQIAPVPLSIKEADESRQAYSTALAGLEADLALHPCRDPTGLVGASRPFLLAYQGEDDCELMRRYGQLCTSLMGPWHRARGARAELPPRARASKLRLGFVCEYVRNHSVYHAILQGWLRRLDRSRFTVDVFCLDARADAQTQAARQMADHFEQGDRSVGEWVRVIAERRPDVLVYPEVGLNATTLQLASLRLARTQMASWGHPVTSGLPTIDYYLSGAAFEPEDGAGHYTERLISLPNFGVYYERPEYPDSAPATPGGSHGPVLVCPGTPFKYSPRHDDVLVAIARRLGSCEFHFFNFEDGALSRRLMHRLTAAFSAAGLDAARFLVLRPWAATPQFHGMLRSADLMLDTIGFSGFNTVMQALECDLPVVTTRGRFMRGRLGSGILERIDLTDLVAVDTQAYVDTVVSLLENRAALAAVRSRIRAGLPRAYDDSSAVAEFEALLLAVA